MLRSKVNAEMCVLHEYDCLLWHHSSDCSLVTVVEGFRCDVISCGLAWRGVPHGPAECSTCVHGNVVSLTSVLDRRQSLSRRLASADVDCVMLAD